MYTILTAIMVVLGLLTPFAIRRAMRNKAHHKLSEDPSGFRGSIGRFVETEDTGRRPLFHMPKRRAKSPSLK